MMRITNRYLANNILYGIQNNIGKLARSQEQIATSKRILRPSDDPNVMGQFMAIKATLSYNLQYDRNLDDALSYLNMNDAAMDTIGGVLAQAGELITQAANDTYSPSDRAAVAEQIDKMIDQVLDLANATVGGKYIYGGMENSKPPFSREGDEISYHGDTNGVYREVLAGSHYRIDAPGITTGVQVAAVNGAAKELGELPQVTQRPANKECVGIIQLKYNGDTIKVIEQTDLSGSEKNSLIDEEGYTLQNADPSGFVFEVTAGDLKGLKIEFPGDMEDGAVYSFTIDNRLGVFGNAYLSNSVVYNPDAPKEGVDRGIFDALFTLRDRLNNNDTAGFQESINELQEKTDQLLQHRVQVGARTRHFESIKMQLLDQEVKLTESLDKIEGANMARLSIEVSQQGLTYMASLAIGSQILQTSLLDFLR